VWEVPILYRGGVLGGGIPLPTEGGVWGGDCDGFLCILGGIIYRLDVCFTCKKWCFWCSKTNIFDLWSIQLCYSIECFWSRVKNVLDSQ